MKKDREREYDLIYFTNFYRSFVNEVGPKKAAEIAYSVLSSRYTAYALAIICRMGQLRAEYLLEVGIPSSSIYKVIRKMKKLGLIEVSEKVQTSGRGGPATNVWRLKY